MAEQEGSGEATSSSGQTPLSEVFDNRPAPAASKEEASAEDSASEKEEKGADQKFPEGESSSDDSKDQKSDKPEDKASDKPEEKKLDEKKAESKPADKKEDKPSDDKAKDKWETEENPFVKRFKDTAANWNKEHQENLQLRNAVSQMQQEMVVLRKMADGTYDPEKDDPAKQVTHEDVANRALSVGKTLASRNAAVQQFGAEEVNNRLNEFNQLFENNPMVNKVVLESEAPVFEAFRILDRYKFEQKYGTTPADWHKAIRAEADKELRETIRKEVTEEIMGRVDKKKGHPSFSSSRGSNGLGKDAKPKSNGPTPLKQIFN